MKVYAGFRTAGIAVTCLSLLGVGLLGGCGSSPPPAPVEATPTINREVPPLLKGTVLSEVTFRNVEPVLVSGFGLVVGLSGTGGGQLPDNVASTMEREMGLMGIGKSANAGGSLEGKTPRQVLRDPNVAVVIVQAAIPPGAPANARFDVYVKALNASSLEGGTLWTTNLRFGDPAVFGAAQQRSVAKARGAIFINPFAEEGREQQGLTRDVGRVLDGGWVTEPQPIVLTLDNASWSRARGIVSAVNSRFPEGPGDPGPAARGRSQSVVEVRVPRRYRTNPRDFVSLVQHLAIDQQFPEQMAKRWAEGLKAEPGLADDLAWCLEGIGTKATPFLADLYDYPEIVPRMAALQAGARLGDPRAAEGLTELAVTGGGSVKLRAIELLGELDGSPRVDVALRDLVAQPELAVRVTAYESLVTRAERSAAGRIRARQDENPDGVRISPTAVELLAQAAIPKRNMQGLERRIQDGKFILDIMPFGEPLIYVTQQGQPRIVLLGEQNDLVRPMIATAWSNRLMVQADEGGPVQVRYSPAGTIGAVTGTVNGGLVDLIEFLARKPAGGEQVTGFNMSYSEVVGALSAVSESRGTRAAFATEQNRLRAAVLAATSGRERVERPEKPGDEPIVIFRQPTVIDSQPTTPSAPKIVPIEGPTKK